MTCRYPAEDDRDGVHREARGDEVAADHYCVIAAASIDIEFLDRGRGDLVIGGGRLGDLVGARHDVDADAVVAAEVDQIDVEGFGRAGAVELEGVGIVLVSAIDDVVTIADIVDDRIVAIEGVDCIVVSLALNRVVLAGADEDLAAPVPLRVMV